MEQAVAVSREPTPAPLPSLDFAAVPATHRVPHIPSNAWFFHTALLPALRTLRRRSSGGSSSSTAATPSRVASFSTEQAAASPTAQQHRRKRHPRKSRDGDAAAEPPLAPSHPPQVLSPPLRAAEAGSVSPEGSEAAEPPHFFIAADLLFFEDAPRQSDSPGDGEDAATASLVDRFSLRTLFTARCRQLGMRRPPQAVLRQLPSAAGREAALELRSLVLRDTYLPAKACQALTVLLPYCPELEVIDISSASLKTASSCVKGIDAFLDALLRGNAQNGIGRALHMLNLSHNRLSDRTGWRLVRLLEQHRGLRMVNVEGTGMSQDMKACIEEAMRRNSRVSRPLPWLTEADTEEADALVATTVSAFAGSHNSAVPSQGGLSSATRDDKTNDSGSAARQQPRASLVGKVGGSRYPASLYGQGGAMDYGYGGYGNVGADEDEDDYDETELAVSAEVAAALVELRMRLFRNRRQMQRVYDCFILPQSVEQEVSLGNSAFNAYGSPSQGSLGPRTLWPSQVHLELLGGAPVPASEVMETQSGLCSWKAFFRALRLLGVRSASKDLKQSMQFASSCGVLTAESVQFGRLVNLLRTHVTLLPLPPPQVEMETSATTPAKMASAAASLLPRIVNPVFPHPYVLSPREETVAPADAVDMPSPIFSPVPQGLAQNPSFRRPASGSNRSAFTAVSPASFRIGKGFTVQEGPAAAVSPRSAAAATRVRTTSNVGMHEVPGWTPDEIPFAAVEAEAGGSAPRSGSGPRHPPVVQTATVAPAGSSAPTPRSAAADRELPSGVFSASTGSPTPGEPMRRRTSSRTAQEAMATSTSDASSAPRSVTRSRNERQQEQSEMRRTSAALLQRCAATELEEVQAAGGPSSPAGAVDVLMAGASAGGARHTVEPSSMEAQYVLDRIYDARQSLRAQLRPQSLTRQQALHLCAVARTRASSSVSNLDGAKGASPVIVAAPHPLYHHQPLPHEEDSEVDLDVYERGTTLTVRTTTAVTEDVLDAVAASLAAEEATAAHAILVTPPHLQQQQQPRARGSSLCCWPTVDESAPVSPRGARKESGGGGDASSPLAAESEEPGVPAFWRKRFNSLFTRPFAYGPARVGSAGSTSREMVAAGDSGQGASGRGSGLSAQASGLPQEFAGTHWGAMDGSGSPMYGTASIGDGSRVSSATSRLSITPSTESTWVRYAVLLRACVRVVGTERFELVRAVLEHAGVRDAATGVTSRSSAGGFPASPTAAARRKLSSSVEEGEGPFVNYETALLQRLQPHVVASSLAPAQERDRWMSLRIRDLQAMLRPL